MCQALEDAGCRVELAEDGIAALGRVRHFQPDVVLLDLRMPQLDGAEVPLRAGPQPARVRVVLTTAAT